MTGFEKAYEPCAAHAGAAVLTIDVPVGALRYAGRICHGCAAAAGDGQLATALIDLLGHATAAPDIAPALEEVAEQEARFWAPGALAIDGRTLSVHVPVAGREGILAIMIGIGQEHAARRRAAALLRDAFGGRRG